WSASIRPSPRRSRWGRPTRRCPARSTPRRSAAASRPACAPPCWSSSGRCSATPSGPRSRWAGRRSSSSTRRWRRRSRCSAPASSSGWSARRCATPCGRGRSDRCPRGPGAAATSRSASPSDWPTPLGSPSGPGSAVGCWRGRRAAVSGKPPASWSRSWSARSPGAPPWPSSPDWGGGGWASGCCGGPTWSARASSGCSPSGCSGRGCAARGGGRRGRSAGSP
ncbi:MAG: hypothetical protein AVDCRST_MAG49-1556, partial [uncultured Thermomicrobiales bacterium]